jgi:hypothetical protein
MERMVRLRGKSCPKDVYLVTSDDVPGLAAHGRAANEMLEIAYLLAVVPTTAPLLFDTDGRRLHRTLAATCFSGCDPILVNDHKHAVSHVNELLTLRSEQLVGCVLKDLNISSVAFHDTRTINDITSFKTHSELGNKMRG